MRKMKDSGIEWIGEIPEEWKIQPAYCYFGERKHKNYRAAETNLLSLSYGNIIRKDINTNEGLLPESFNTYNIVEDGDIIIRPTDLQNDKKSLRTGLCKERGIITSAYIALKPIQPANTDYFHYLLHTYDVIKVFYNMGNGVRQGLNFSEFSHLMLLEPPKNEQVRIVTFLDAKCSEIDSLVSDIEKQITTLEQYKRSVITEAVTKGLDPTVPMKDSGIEWIGEIPEGWNPIRLKYIANYNTTTLTENTNADYEFDYIDIGSVTYGKGIEQFQPMKFNDAPSRARRVVKPHDVIVSTVRTYLKAIAYVPEYDRPVVVSTGFLTLTAKPIILPKFLRYAVESEPFVSGIEANSVGISYPAINTSEAIKVTIILPPLSEQHTIAEYLDSKCSEIDSAISLKKQQIEALNDYKKSLIYEYVTGKKEIPA